jgi:hypothetical protein
MTSAGALAVHRATAASNTVAPIVTLKAYHGAAGGIGPDLPGAVLVLPVAA